MTQGRQIVQYACAALDRAEIKKYVEFFILTNVFWIKLFINSLLRTLKINC